MNISIRIRGALIALAAVAALGCSTAEHDAEPALARVPAAHRSASAHYQAEFTLGWPTQDKGNGTNAQHHVEGRALGAKGSLP